MNALKEWTVCPTCARHTPYGCRTCRRPLRLTERGRDVLWVAHFLTALLTGLALAAAVNTWI